MGHNEAYYMDSFEGIPLEEIPNICEDNNLELIYNIHRIQDLKSRNCELFCINYLDNVNDFDSYNNWLMKFSQSDFKENDEIILSKF